jgi:hypothetical protein
MMSDKWAWRMCDAGGMMKRRVVCVVMGIGVLAGGRSPAQEKGGWRAASATAKSVTGDLFFTEDKLTMNFMRYPLAEIRALAPAEAAAVFDADLKAGSGNLYRVSIPADMRFLHKNTLCSGEETDWVVTYVSGKSLMVAMFTGEKIPTLTAEAMLSDSGTLCGKFEYVR